MTIAADIREQALALMQDPSMSDRAIAQQLGIGNKTVSRWRRDAGLGRPDAGAETSLGPGELARELAERGISVGQFRRWRRAGLLPAPRRSWYRGGSRSDHAPEVVDHAVEVAQVVKRHRSLDQATLALFAAGRPVSEDAVRRVYVAHMERVERDLLTVNRILREFNAFTDVAFDALYEAAARGGRLAWARRLMRMQGAGDQTDIGGAVIDYLDDASAALLDRPGAAGPMLDRMQRRHVVRPLNAAEIATLPDVMKATTVSALLATAERAPLHELDEACAEVTLLFIVVGGLVLEVMLRMGGVDPAAHMPAFLDDDALVARVALIVAAAKRDPKIGTSLTTWLLRLYEPHTAREAIPALEATLPALQAELLAVAQRP